MNLGESLHSMSDAHVLPPLRELTGGAQTLAQLLEHRQHVGSETTRFVRDYRRDFTTREGTSEVLTRQQQWGGATRAAASLKAAGVGKGDHVVLLLPDSSQFLAAFFGCQVLGAIAVPLVPPWSLDRVESHVARIIKVCEVCRPRATVLSKDALTAVTAFAESGPAEKRLGSLLRGEDLLNSRDLAERDSTVLPSDPAMVQFTSGSTAAPRGVVLSHQALLANCYAIGKALDFHQPHHVGCSWLPLFHDMGLIGHVLVPLLFGIPNVLLPPESFALRPESWLEAISAFGATISTAPNFAYQLCAERLSAEKIADFDLSRWSVALCGGEPVLSKSLQAFAERFSPHGFQSKALCPVYGLAEFSLAVTLSSPYVEPKVDAIDRTRFAQEGVATLALDPSDTLLLVSSGSAAPGHDVRIVDSDDVPLPDAVEGKIQARGPSLMSGYLNNEEATRAAICEGWLNTGDRGYLKDSELYVTGRDKEIIIKGGRNLYPQEIELAAAQVDGVRKGRVIAFGLVDEASGTDLFVLLCESRETAAEKLAQMERAVLFAVREAVGVRPDQVLILAPGTLTKTSSGKLQRVSAAQRFLDGDLKAPQANSLKLAKLWVARSKLFLKNPLG